MPREETLNYYQNKVNEVLDYIQHNLDKELNVKTLALKSNISFFHFHRIIKASLGIPLGTYVNKLRLDTAVKLIKYSSDPIGEIALKIGYNDVSAFTKSFVREFGISPSDYRLNKESSINSHIDLHWKEETLEMYNLSPKIKIIPTREVAYFEVKGIYGGQEVEEAWKLLFDYAVANKLIGWNPDALSIYYDDPDEVGAENCVCDICMVIKRKPHPTGSIKIKEIAGGKFLVFRYKGPYEKLWGVYNYLFQHHIILLDKYKLRDAPMLEKYVKYSEKTKPENQITDIFIPVL